MIKYKQKSAFGDILMLLFVIIISAIILSFSKVRFYKSAFPQKYEELVNFQSSSMGVEPSLVYAVIRTASGFNELAESSVGAKGLMQITEETFGWLLFRTGSDIVDSAALYDPYTNVYFGTALVKILLDEFGTVENALCAYHAGWGNAKSWLTNPKTSSDGIIIDNIPFGDTNRYVTKVIKTQEIYKTIYNIT